MTTGTRRRRAAEWRGLVQEWRKSGQTRDEFAAARGLRPTTLGWWASELARRGQMAQVANKSSSPAVQPAFLPVRVVGRTARTRAAIAVAPTAVESTVDHAEIVLGAGLVLRVPVGADATWIGRIAAVLQQGERC